MENHLKYQVRSREIIDLIAAMRSGRLILSPYFQRNLVWRDTHKKDFIDTILKGFPFPQVFLARGPINLDTMDASTCVVDGQQRLTAIKEFVSGDFDVNGSTFGQLEPKKKEDFLKYEVPVIDFDLEATDERLKDIFRRLNRTFYALSTIEKIASEYSSSEFLLLARLLSGDFSKNVGNDEFEIEQDLLPELSLDKVSRDAENAFLVDPGIDAETLSWLNNKADGSFSKLVASDMIFSNYEAQRKVPIMFVLNVVTTVLVGYYNRNTRVKELLDQYMANFDIKDNLIEKLNTVADYINSMGLPQKSMWWNKANFYSLVVETFKADQNLLDPQEAKVNLLAFEADVPASYGLAAREGVNNRNERILRGGAVRTILTGIANAVVDVDVIPQIVE